MAVRDLQIYIGSATRFETVAIGFPMICPSFPASVNLENFPYLELLEFADSLHSYRCANWFSDFIGVKFLKAFEKVRKDCGRQKQM